MKRAEIYITTFLKKPLREKWLLIRIIMLLFMVRFLLFVLPFKHFSKLLGKPADKHSEDAPNPDPAYTATVSRYISNCSRLVPWDSKCLAQAAAGKMMMRKKGIPATVFFGVKKGDGNEKIKAHAWLSVGPEIVLGGDVAGEYSPISRFA
ncbi:MAG: lasso peptide biosynthesis B2 protein [Balneolaceae bacterium]|nr:lasso peptide biosynthesis B2 protein [Balneolaceae bacterium]